LIDFSTRPRRRIGLLDGGLVVAGLLGLGLAAASAIHWSLEARRRAAETERLASDARGAATKLERMRSGRGPRESTLVAQIEAAASLPPPRVAADLAALLPPDARLRSLDITYGDRVSVDLQVSARGSSAYDAFLQRLADSPLFLEVLPGPEGREGEVLASLRLTYRAPEAP
jgi:hypothetical protein